jgi:succinate dehydrogenase hydrophobic anchor subunit
MKKETMVMQMFTGVSLTVFITIFIIMAIVSGTVNPSEWGERASLTTAYIWGFFLGSAITSLIVLGIWYAATILHSESEYE